MAVHEEPMRDIAHLGRVELLTSKPDESLWYFRDLLGMEVVHREGQSVFLRGWGDYAASTLKLTEAKQPGVGYVAWRAISPQALERRAAAIEQAGMGIGWSNGDFGIGRCYRFRDPDGHQMVVYYDEQKYEPPEHLRSALRNQPQRFTGRGVGVRRSDHLALLARDVAANREFVELTLGCQLREQIRFDHGKTRDRLRDGQEGAAWPAAPLLALGGQPRGRAARRRPVHGERHLHRGRAQQAQQLAGILPLFLRAGR
jgi:catechol 2,3-dioxygenase